MIPFALAMILSLQISPFETRATVDQPDPLVGEPIMLELTVMTPPGHTVTFPDYPEETELFSIAIIDGPETVERDGETWHNLQLRVVPWNTGDLPTPAGFAIVTNSSTFQETPVELDAVMLNISSVLDASNPSLRPPKPLMDLFVIPISVLIGGGVVVAGAITGGVWGARMWWRARGTRRLLTVEPVVQSVVEQSITSLQAIRQMPDLREQNAAVGRSLRDYLGGRFGITASDMTTEEVVVSLADETLSARRQRELAFLLEQSDMAKFSPENLGQKHASLVDYALRWIQAVERSA